MVRKSVDFLISLGGFVKFVHTHSDDVLMKLKFKFIYLKENTFKFIQINKSPRINKIPLHMNRIEVPS